MERSTKRTYAHTIWPTALSDTAMAHGTTGHKAVRGLIISALMQRTLGAGGGYYLAPEQVLFAFTDLTNGHTNS